MKRQLLRKKSISIRTNSTKGMANKTFGRLWSNIIEKGLNLPFSRIIILRCYQHEYLEQLHDHRVQHVTIDPSPKWRRQI